MAAAFGLMPAWTSAFSKGKSFPVVRTPKGARKFNSSAIENAITVVQKRTNNYELGWLFENCFPNTLDTTVDFNIENGKPDTYVITGDIDAMWLRDSSAQVWPYLSFVGEDPKLKTLIEGVINRQTKCILLDPYANAFFKDDTKISGWKDQTEMKPGVSERKWEVDSLCYTIRLAYGYWKKTGDTRPFDQDWKKAVETILRTFKEQQRKSGAGPYHFSRHTSSGTDGATYAGIGFPVKPNGLICSMFRPSDDLTTHLYLIPSNFFAVQSMKQVAEMVAAISKDNRLANECSDLAKEVEAALKAHSIVKHKQFGHVYAYETNGFESYLLMDDANVPSLLSLPYLTNLKASDPVYQNTRKMIWSEHNPYFYKSDITEGIGGPHTGANQVWPISIIMKGLTSNNDAEIKTCIRSLQTTHGHTGFMHESFDVNQPANFSRSWFAWANTLFGELIWKTYQTKPQLLDL